MVAVVAKWPKIAAKRRNAILVFIVGVLSISAQLNFSPGLFDGLLTFIYLPTFPSSASEHSFAVGSTEAVEAAEAGDP